MKAYKYDTHVHTAETSCCARVTGTELVHLYKDAGFQGVVITDHYYRSYFESLGDISWSDKVSKYLQGYYNALEEASVIGVDVILGMEIRFTENPNDYLIYGFDEDFLINNPELYNMGLESFRAYTRDMGILIYQAHPFRPSMIPANPRYLDGIEVFNGNPRHDSKNSSARAYAVQHNLKMVCGSDFHESYDLARGGIILPERLNTSFELARLLKNTTSVELLSCG